MALFVEVARVMSFRRAAEVLAIPNSTVSRRIAALEKSVGLRLLHRTTRRIELTEAGRLYFEQARRIVEDAHTVHAQLGRMVEQPSGVLRASFPVDFAIEFLTPLVIAFADAFPAIAFSFDIGPRNVDLVSEPFDLAIRIGPQPDSQMIARPLTSLRFHPYASPAYLERHGTPAVPADLAQRECLDFPGVESWTLHREGETAVVPIDGRFRLNSRGMIRQLVIRHQGVAMLPERLLGEAVSTGRLQRILPDWHGADLPVFVVTETRLLPAKTQAFIDFLRLWFKRL